MKDRVDRVTAGFLSGILAAIAMNLIDWTGYLLGFYNEQLLDWASVILHGALPTSTFQIIWSQLGQIFFGGILGIIFAYVLLKLNSENIFLKGWLFGIISWFSIYAISILFRLSYMNIHHLNTTISHFLSASVFGIILAKTLTYLNKLANNKLR